MRWNKIITAVGMAMLFLAVMMIVPLLVGISYGEKEIVRPWLIAIGFTALVGFFLFRIFRSPQKTSLTRQEGIAIVAFTWISIVLIGALPLYLTSSLGITDAIFEAISGFTTTGFTAYTNVEILPRTILFWRSLMHWMGGMGIIVLSIAILPFLGVGGGTQMFKAELSNPTGDKVRPRIQDTARALWKVYLFLTIAEIVLLMIGGMTLFDSVCHSFSTVATGGFTTKNSSIAFFNSAYIEVVITIFMILSGISYALFYYMIIKKDYLTVWRNPEVRFYLGVILVFASLISVSLYFTQTFDSLGISARRGLFQFVSILTTTGFSSFDHSMSPIFIQAVLFLAMFLGACTGSTTGGLKMYRVMLYCKFCYHEIFQLIHSRAVRQIKISSKVVAPELVRNALGFLGLYLFICIVGILALTAMSVDGLTASASVISCMGNGGLTLGALGPSGDGITSLPIAARWVLSFCMLAGRLEIYTILILLVPAFWRK